MNVFKNLTRELHKFRNLLITQYTKTVALNIFYCEEKQKVDLFVYHIECLHVLQFWNHFFVVVWASSSIHCLAALDSEAGVEQSFDFLIIHNRRAVQSMQRSMDWTLEDIMGDDLFFCATLTSRRKGHNTFVQAGAETSNTDAEAVKPNPACSCKSHSGKLGAVVMIIVQSLVRLSNHSAFHWWSAQTAALLFLLSNEVISCCAPSTNGCPHLRCHAFRPVGQVSAKWSRCPGSMAWRAKESVAPLRRSSSGWMPERIGRLSAGVGHRHPVTIRKALLMAGSIRQVWALQHHTGAQYSAAEWTSTVCSVAPAPQSSQSYRAILGVQRVMSTFYEVSRGVGKTWATCPMLLWGIWVQSRKAGFCCCGWLLAHAWLPYC